VFITVKFLVIVVVYIANSYVNKDKYFKAHRHIEAISCRYIHLQCARRPAPVRARYSNRLDPENKSDIRNVPPLPSVLGGLHFQPVKRNVA